MQYIETGGKVPAQNGHLQGHRDGGVRRRILLIAIIPKVFTRALMVMPHALQHATNKLDRRLALGSHPEDLLALTAPPEIRDGVEDMLWHMGSSLLLRVHTFKRGCIAP